MRSNLCHNIAVNNNIASEDYAILVLHCFALFTDHLWETGALPHMHTLKKNSFHPQQTKRHRVKFVCGMKDIDCTACYFE